MLLLTQEMAAEDAGECVGEPEERFVVGPIVAPEQI